MRFVVVLDLLVANLALPAIQRDLGLGAGALTWVVNAYALCFGGFLLLAGRVSDLVGRRRTLLAGTLAFGAASLACGLAGSPAALLAARAVQGAGGAAMVPAALAALLAAAPARDAQLRGLVWWGCASAVAGSVGLLLGGVVVDALGWRWIFLANVPLALVVAIGAARALPRDGASERPAVRSFDAGGAIAVTAGLSLLVLALTSAQERGPAAVATLAAGAGAVALLAAFVAIERRHPAPLVRLVVLRVRSVAAANALTIAANGISISVVAFTSLYLQRALGWSATGSGLALAPTALGVLAGSLWAPRLRARIGLRATVVAGFALMAAGAALLVRIGPAGAYAEAVLPTMLVLYVGTGLLAVALTWLATAGLPARDAGLASGLVSTSGQMGVALWLAGSAVVLAAFGGEAAARDPAALVGGLRHVFALDAAVAALAAVAVLTSHARTSASTTEPPVHG